MQVRMCKECVLGCWRVHASTEENKNNMTEDRHSPSPQNKTKKKSPLFSYQKNAGADYVMLLKINNNLMGYHIINYNLIMNYNYKLF